MIVEPLQPAADPRRVQAPTELTLGLLNALDRPPLASITPGTPTTLLAGFLTAGIYPAYALPRKWLRNLRWHRNVLWHLGEWTMVNIGVEEGRQLHQATSGRLPMVLAQVAALCAILSLAAVAVGVSLGARLLDFWTANPFVQSADPVFVTFHAGLLGAFSLTWLSINLYLRRLHRLRRIIEQITPQLASVRGLRVSRFEPGIRPVSGLLGLLLLITGFPWALPMLITSTAQRRTVLIHDRRIRAQVAQRLRELIDRRRPVVTLPPVVDRVGMCRNEVCDQVLPPDALFCARCGAPQRPLGRILE